MVCAFYLQLPAVLLLLHLQLLTSVSLSFLLGKNWHTPKKAFRPTSGLKSYEKRLQERNDMAAMKEREKELKDEKEAERQVGNRVHDMVKKRSSC